MCVSLCVCNVKTSKRNYKWLTICLVCLCASVHDSIASERMSYVHTTALTAVNETAARRRRRVPAGRLPSPARGPRGAPGGITAVALVTRIMPFQGLRGPVTSHVGV